MKKLFSFKKKLNSPCTYVFISCKIHEFNIKSIVRFVYKMHFQCQDVDNIAAWIEGAQKVKVFLRTF